MMPAYLWIACSVLPFSLLVAGSWDVPASRQYHIQTDEGPERYFRFQTDNGQFRKERRLQDGTVIGTEAWIDAAGFLRQKDYIADTKGYRILKSKTVFVGQGRPIEDALKTAKTVSAQSGRGLVGGNSLPNSIDYSTQQKHAAAGGYIYPTTTTTARPTRPLIKNVVPTSSPASRTFGYLSPAEAAKLEPSPYLGYDHYPDEQQTPRDAAAVPPPSLTVEPPLPTVEHRRPAIRPIGLVSDAPAPIAAEKAAPPLSGYSLAAPFRAPLPVPSTGYHYARQSTEREAYDAATHDSSLPLDINNLRLLQPPHPPTTHRRSRPPQPQPSSVQSNTLDNVYEPAAAPGLSVYDGVSATRNGFRYFLPTHYHEEEEVGDDKRAGSFGYVDPFGIRRVVYYNASPEKGFVHRKNNRYVGLNAPPYDPRP